MNVVLALLEQEALVFVSLILWRYASFLFPTSVLTVNHATSRAIAKWAKAIDGNFARGSWETFNYLQLRILILLKFLVLISSFSNHYHLVDVPELKGVFLEFEVSKFASLQEQIFTFWKNISQMLPELLKIFISGISLILPHWPTEKKNKS